jgi:hypothetical protein
MEKNVHRYILSANSADELRRILRQKLYGVACEAGGGAANIGASVDMLASEAEMESLNRLAGPGMLSITKIISEPSNA